MRFCEASAKDNFNVDEIFLKLVDDILKKVKKNMWKYLIWNLLFPLLLFWSRITYFEREVPQVFPSARSQVTLLTQPVASSQLWAASSTVWVFVVLGIDVQYICLTLNTVGGLTGAGIQYAMFIWHLLFFFFPPFSHKN